jgi:IS5 family transposase
MLGRSRKSRQLDMFEVPMNKYLNPEHDLILAGDTINWTDLENEYKSYYSDRGRPAVALRKIIGLCMLKSRYRISDEKCLNIWLENPYWQYFCGEVHFQTEKPFSAGEFTRFRRRVGESGMTRIQALAAEQFGIHNDSTYKNFDDQVKVSFFRRLFNR